MLIHNHPTLGFSWERYTLKAEARSIYLLQGPSRTAWEHSIPQVDRPFLRHPPTLPAPE